MPIHSFCLLMRPVTFSAPIRALAACALALGVFSGCDSGGPGGGSGDLRVSLSTSDVMIANVASGSLFVTNEVVVVATVEGAEAVTAVSASLPWLDAALDSSVVAGPNRARAYIRLRGVQNRSITPGPATLTLSAGGASVDAPITTHTGNVGPLQQNQFVQGVQLTHGREALAAETRVRVRVADAPAGFSVREEAAGALLRTFATATAAVPPNVAHRVLLHHVTAEGWAYATVPFVVPVRSVAANAAVRVRTRSVGGGLRSGTFSNSLTAVAQSGALVTRSAPGGELGADLNGLRGLAPSLSNVTYLLYRDGRLGRVANDLERLGVAPLGDFDPADVAPDGSLLLRDGSVWVGEASPAYVALDVAARTFSVLPYLPTSADAFVAITSDWPIVPVTTRMLLAASADGRLWAASSAQRLAPTAQRLPSAPREMVTVGAALYAARLADGSVWTWRADVQGQPSSLTAPVRIDGITAARLFEDEYAVVMTRADGRVASWGRPFPSSSPCTLFALCERPEWTGLRESTSAGYVRADGLVFSTVEGQIAFAGQPPLVAPE